MKKKGMAALLAAIMALCLWPAGTALAASATSVQIGSVTLSDTTPYYVNGASGAQGTVSGLEPAAWNAWFDIENGTLHLNGLNISVAGNNQIGFSQHYTVLCADGDITIELAGDSCITNTAEINIASGVYCKGNLTVSGKGALTGTVTGSRDFSYGIYTNGEITVKSGTLTGKGGPVTGSSSSSYGIYAPGGITVTNGTLTGKGGPVTGSSSSSYGIYAPSGITVTNGTLTGIGGTANKLSDGDTYCISCGVYTSIGTITVTGGTLTGRGGETDKTMTGTNNGSYGVRTQSGTIAVGGGTLTGTGGSGRTSVGVEGALITVTSGGTITGRGGPGGRAHSFGIYTINDIAIGDGCALIGTGGTASNDGGSYGARVPDSESIPDSGNITVTEGGALTLKGQTKVLFSDGSALTANENKQYKYRISNNFASIPTDFTQSGTTPYTHASSYQYVQILPAAHPEPPTGVTLSQTAPKEGVSLTASIAPPEALTFTDTLYNTITAAPRYQWYTNGNATTTDGTPISGATEKSYCPTATDVGKYLYVTVLPTTILTACPLLQRPRLYRPPKPNSTVFQPTARILRAPQN